MCAEDRSVTQVELRAQASAGQSLTMVHFAICANRSSRAAVPTTALPQAGAVRITD